MKIDLNADLGEGCASDSALLQLVSSANIACGFHAGDAVLMQQCVREALKNGVAIGAHPSFPDRENSVEPRCSYRQRRSTPVLYQIGALAAIVHARGELRHVKPHGMLPTGRRKSRLWPTLSPVRCAMPTPTGAGWAGGQRAYPRRTALSVDDAPEVFADRGYQADGGSVPRSQPGALIESEEQALAQTLKWCSTIGCAA